VRYFIMACDDEDIQKTKRPSTYRYALCTFCKQRHAPPCNEQCLLALLDASERGESPPPSTGVGARPKIRHPPATVVANGETELNLAHSELSQPGGVATATGEVEDEEVQVVVDPALAHMAQFLEAFYKKVDSCFDNLQRQVTQLRDEGSPRLQAARPRECSPAHVHQVS
jgi:hypothetical protein